MAGPTEAEHRLAAYQERLATTERDVIEYSKQVHRLKTVNATLLQVAKSVVYVHEHSGPNAQFILRGLVDDARAAIELASELAETD